MTPAIYQTSLPNLRNRGKVRDIYELGDRLLIVATDRISAFDVVMREPIAGKGVILTELSRFWFETLAALRPHHLEYVVDAARIPAGLEAHSAQLVGRAMVVRKAQVLPIECVVRGYLVGGGWREYQETGSVSGVPLPRGLQLAQRLDEPIFTPSTKAAHGHDEPISFEQAARLVEKAVMQAARRRSLEIYAQAARWAESRGIILADTKFEFGLCRDELLVVDEVLTPDSSRFWPAEEYCVGRNPPSFDKQYLRDYLESTGWNKTPPAPPLPPQVCVQTRARYLQAYHRLTGRDLVLG